MDEKNVTKGVCSICNSVVSRAGAKSHINKCLDQVDESATDAFLIKVQWPHKNPIYWLYLSVPFKSTLEKLDSYLRNVWLECCGHLSQFVINHKRYSSDFEPDPYLSYLEFPMTIRCDKVLFPDVKFIHEYDFGTTTELLLEVVGVIKSVSKNKIELVMRNQEPTFICSFCDKKAAFVCAQNEYRFCNDCVDFDDERLYLLPLLNSPRTGVCGYGG